MHNYGSAAVKAVTDLIIHQEFPDEFAQFALNEVTDCRLPHCVYVCLYWLETKEVP